MGESLKQTTPRRKKPEEVVAENIEALIASAPEGAKTTLGFAKYVGVGNGTIDRLRKGDAAARVSTLATIAAKFKLDAWQLMIEGLDPATPPHLLTPSEQALYAKFESLMGDLKDRGYQPPPVEQDLPVRAEPMKRTAHRFRKRRS